MPTAISFAFTSERAAKMLNVSEEMIQELSEGLEPEDGLIAVYGVEDEGVVVFTELGIENLRTLLEEQRR